MDHFAFQAPRILEIGGGPVARAPALLARLRLTRPLIVSDPVMVSSGLIERLTAPLGDAGIAFDIFSETIPEPTDTVVEAGVARLRNQQARGALPTSRRRRADMLIGGSSGRRFPTKGTALRTRNLFQGLCR